MATEFEHLHTAFNIEDEAFVTRFEDALEHLVTECPVARSQVGPGYHVFNRYQDVRKIGQDWRTFSSADGWMMDPPEGNIPILPEDLDPPYHTAWRKVLNPYFNAKAVTQLENHARNYAKELIEGFADSGRCEFVADFAAKLPGLILFRHILPVPVVDLPQLFADIDSYSFGPVEERAAAFGRVQEYLELFLKGRQNEAPKGDLVDVILAGVKRDGSTCPWEDKVHTALDVVFGGLATTTHAMSGAMYEMARRPSVRAAVVSDPARMHTAVEETVRLYAPVVMAARTVRNDVEINGMKIAAGERVALNFAAASRDPDVCSNPREFDVERAEVVHTAFGIGPHRCIGEHLARLEIRVAVEEFLKRIPDVYLESDAQLEYESGQLRTMKKLPLRWA
jgi:cytochrome P450